MQVSRVNVDGSSVPTYAQLVTKQAIKYVRFFPDLGEKVKFLSEIRTVEVEFKAYCC